MIPNENYLKYITFSEKYTFLTNGNVNNRVK